MLVVSSVGISFAETSFPTSPIWHTRRRVCSRDNKKKSNYFIAFFFFLIWCFNYQECHFRPTSCSTRYPRPSTSTLTSILDQNTIFTTTLNSVLGCGEHQKCFWHVTGKNPICRVKTTDNAIGK